MADGLPPSDARPLDAASADAAPAADAAPPTSVIAIAAGRAHTCAVLDNGAVRCWGEGSFGRLGYGNPDTVGDTETPASIGNVPLGASAKDIATGEEHTCALLTTGKLRCWGRGVAGALGYGGSGESFNIGDDEPPADAGDVPLLGIAEQVACGEGHTCARMDSGAVRCWGWNGSGQLGAGHDNNVLTAALSVEVNLGVGRTALHIDSEGQHTCALLDNGAVRCWGRNDHGQLGLGNSADFGDDPGETPNTVDPVDLGVAAIHVAAGLQHSCAVLNGGGVRCWGEGQLGRLGYADLYGYDDATTDPVDIGDDEPLTGIASIDLGSVAERNLAGGYHSCAISDTAKLRCWGSHQVGALGYGAASSNIGDNEAPSSAGDVLIGETISAAAAGTAHSCVLLTRGAIRCWGANDDGRLGYGDTEMRGRSDATVPQLLDDVPVIFDL